MEIVDYLLARKKAGGSDVTIEQLSVTENGTYSEQGIAYSPVVVDVPAPENSYQLTDIPAGTVSTIEDGTDLPMSSLKVGIEPVQDLHGYDHPWAGGAGKNLLNYDAWKNTPVSNGTAVWENNGVTLTASGNDCFTSYNNWTDDKKIYVSGGETITLSWEESTNTRGNIYIFMFSDGAAPGSIFVNNSEAKKISYTVASGVRYITFRFGVSYAGNTISYKNIQIEKGSTATSYEPYSNICPISGWTAANVTRTGKNLWNTDDITSILVGTVTRKGLYFRSPGQYTVSAQNSGNYLYCRIFNADGTIKETYYIVSMSVITNATFTISDGEYFAVYDAMESSIDLAKTRFNSWLCQVELGSSATTYEPYNSTTYTIQFRDGDNPLTVYGGTLDVTTGELVVDRAFLTNDYLVNTADYESAGRNCYILIGITLKTLGASVIDDKLIASALKTGSQDDLYSNHKIGIAHWWNTRIAFSTGDSNVTSKSVFKEWLANNGSDVCYELAEPTTYHLTPTQIRTLVGNNNIWADTGDVLSGKYFKEL